MRATTEIFRHADAALVDNALGAVLRLRSLAGCADVKALRAAFEPIGDAEKQRAVVAAARDVADVVARYNAGRCEEAMPLARSVAQRVRKVGYRPVEAEASYWLGRTEHVCGSAKAAAEALFVAATSAEESHQDELLARSLTEMAYVQGAELARYDEANDFARFAGAAIWRAGAPEVLLSELARARGWIEYTRGDLVAALPLRREALERHVRAMGDDDPDALQLRAEVSDLEYESGQLGEALGEARQVLARSTALLGPRHMRTGRYTLDVAEVLIAQGKYAEAAPLLDQARPIVSANVATNERYVEGIQALGLGDVAGGRSKLDACIRASEASYGQDDPYPISVAGDLALRLALHRSPDAADVARDVVRHIEAVKAQGNPWFATAYAALAITLARDGHGAEAAGLADQAILIAEKGAAQQLPFALLAKGEALLARGSNAEAVAALERARSMVTERGGIDEVALGDIDFAEARALPSSDPRSKSLAGEARAAYAASSEASFAAPVDAWLAKP